MTKQELRENMREMVKYILPDECREDKDIVENYTDTMTMIAEEYHTEQLKLCEVNRSTKIKINEPFEVEETGERFEARINNYIDDNGLWEKRIIIVKIDF